MIEDYLDMETNNNMTTYEISNSIWVIPNRYNSPVPLGQGAYGLVCSANDTKTNEQVAIKKLARPFATPIHAKRAYREIRLLKHVNHDNLICLLDLFTEATNAVDLNEIYFTTHLMGTDLNNVLRTQELGDEQIKFFVYQILRGLKYLHSANIIHRDLKPSNLAVNENCELRIIDFGLARTENNEMTGYVATRWYRAPEIMLSWMHYTKSVDIWSVGCIIAEMYLHRPIFPGNDHVNQLNRILEVVGYPSQLLLSQIQSDAKTFLESMPAKPVRKDFPTYFRQANSPNAISIIDQMLQLDPAKRPTCEEALEHPYLSSYHDIEDEPSGEPFEDNYQDKELTVQEWKDLLFKEITNFSKND